MRVLLACVLACLASLAHASPSDFSVYDDLLAFPQFEVVFSESIVSHADARKLLDAEDGHTHEQMWLDGHAWLCATPVVDELGRNVTAATSAAMEATELARATHRGAELLQDLEGNCMYQVVNWWSYAFCYNAQVTQFHQLPPSPANPYPPRRDKSTPEFVLGRAQIDASSNHDEWGNEMEIADVQGRSTMTTELQIKGDTRYLVQRMAGGTICDLTGEPRRIEVQFHCNPDGPDRIAYIKEITTCSYVMVIYTPRLCNDVAFMPPKETAAHAISCRRVVDEWSAVEAVAPQLEELTIGGIVVGGGQHVSEGQQLSLPTTWNKATQHPTVEVLMTSSNGRVDALTAEDLREREIDPEVVEELRAQVERKAGNKAWKLEVVDLPGELRELRAIIENEDEDKKDEL